MSDVKIAADPNVEGVVRISSSPELPRPHVVVVGAIHGNEPCGLHALRQIQHEAETHTTALKKLWNENWDLVQWLSFLVLVQRGGTPFVAIPVVRGWPLPHGGAGGPETVEEWAPIERYYSTQRFLSSISIIVV